MKSFEPSFLEKQRVPFSLLNAFFQIYKCQKQMEADRLSFPRLYRTLAREQRKEALRVGHHTTQEKRDYTRALAYIRKKHRSIPFSLRTILNLHAQVFHTSDKPKGVFKSKNNRVLVNSEITQGFVRCVPHHQCEKYMRELTRRFKRAWNSGKYDPLVLIAAWKLDFCQIHPFKDGNGRTGRLMLALLLYHAGHDICSYVNLENKINRNRGRYVRPIFLSDIYWRQGKHELQHCCEFLAWLVLQSYREIGRKIALKKVRMQNAEVKTGKSQLFLKEQLIFSSSHGKST